MPKPIDTLDRVNINIPCTADWDQMIGNDQVRFCSHCDLSVHNLSAMTKQEAMRLVINSKGKLCARYIRRPNGAILTTDRVLPKLHTITRRASRIAAGAFSAALSISSSVVAAAPASSNATEGGQSSSTFLAKRARSSSFSAYGSILRGTIKDQNGAVIPDATVTLVNNADGLERVVTTDGEGAFVIYNLEEGSFTLKIEGDGFASKNVSNITLSANDDQTVDETLNVEVTIDNFTMGVTMFVWSSEPLVAAAQEQDINKVKELLASGAEVNVLDEGFDSTALTQAVSNGNREIVDLLINAGADVNKRNQSGYTSLMAINESTTADIVWTLIDAGAKTSLRDDDGQDALHYAASSSNPDALRALLDAGAFVDGRDEEDQTALMIAAEAGNTENVSVLLKAGATVNLRDEDGTTALGVALENDNSETAKVLRDFGATE